MLALDVQNSLTDLSGTGFFLQHSMPQVPGVKIHQPGDMKVDFMKNTHDVNQKAQHAFCVSISKRILSLVFSGY